MHNHASHPVPECLMFHLELLIMLLLLHKIELHFNCANLSLQIHSELHILCRPRTADTRISVKKHINTRITY